MRIRWIEWTLLFVPGLLLLVCGYFRLRFNFTRSMPIGIYQLHREREPTRGDWVSVRVPQRILLKQVIGLPGDAVSTSNAHIIVNEISYLAPHLIEPHLKSRQGYWLYGMNDPIHSWDSRYFGAVSREAIQGVVTPIWIQKPAESPAEWRSASVSSINSLGQKIKNLKPKNDNSLNLIKKIFSAGLKRHLYSPQAPNFLTPHTQHLCKGSGTEMSLQAGEEN